MSWRTRNSLLHRFHWVSAAVGACLVALLHTGGSAGLSSLLDETSTPGSAPTASVAVQLPSASSLVEAAQRVGKQPVRPSDAGRGGQRDRDQAGPIPADSHGYAGEVRSPFKVETNSLYDLPEGFQSNPAVAFGGANYLVVWREMRSGFFDIYGARVSVEGCVLDPDLLAISTAAHHQAFPSLAFDGIDYFVVWEDWRSGGSDIYGARVSLAGNVLDPDGIAICTAANDQRFPAVAFDGTNYLVVWEDWRSGGSDIYGARVSVAGSVLDPEGTEICSAGGGRPAVTFDGTNHLVVWVGSGGGYSDIYGARVSPAGSVHDPGGIPICTAPLGQYSPDVAFGGTNCLVVWHDCRNGCFTYGARVTGEGNVLDSDGIAISTAYDERYSPSVDFDENNYLVVWQDLPGASFDVYGARVSVDGSVLDPERVAISAEAHGEIYPEVAFDGNNYLVVWQDGRSGSSQIYGARVSVDGSVLDPDGVAISTGENVCPSWPEWPTFVGSISGVITDSETNEPIREAAVLTSRGLGTETDQSGAYTLSDLPEGEYSVTIEKYGYKTQGPTIKSVDAGNTTTLDAALDPFSPQIEYVGERAITGESSVVLDEPDGKITCGDRVHLRLPFVTRSGPARSVTVQLDQKSRGNGFPAIGFYDAATSSYVESITQDLPDLELGEVRTCDVLIFVEDLEHKDRVNVAGLAPSIELTVTVGDISIKTQVWLILDAIDFTDQVWEDVRVFLQNDFLAHPDDYVVRRYAQYAAGLRSPDMIGVFIDPDCAYDAVSNTIQTLMRIRRHTYWRTLSRISDKRMIRKIEHGKTMGDCKQFSDLTTSLLRSIGIPTRRAYGYFGSACPNCEGSCWWSLTRYRAGRAHQWNESMIEHQGVPTRVFVDSATGQMGLDLCQFRLGSNVGFYDCKAPDWVHVEVKPIAHLDIIPYPWTWLVPCVERFDDWPRWPCVSDATSDYASCVSTPRTQHAESAEDSLSLVMLAPTSVEQGESFALSAVINNQSSASVDSVVAWIGLSPSSTDTLQCYYTPAPVRLIGKIEGGEADTTSWDIVSLEYGRDIVLLGGIECAGAFAIDAIVQNVNRAASRPDLFLEAIDPPDLLRPGDYGSIGAQVRDGQGEFISNCDVIWTQWNIENPGAATEYQLSPAGDDSSYWCFWQVPFNAEPGLYQSVLVASAPNYDPDTLGTSYVIQPRHMEVHLSTSAVQCESSDTLRVSTQITHRNEDVISADVTLRIEVDGRTVTIPMLRQQGATYSCSFRPDDLEQDLGGHTVPSGEWKLSAIAEYLGALEMDIGSIQVMAPDLGISAGSMSFVPDPATAGDYVILESYVCNDGDAVSDTAFVKFYDDVIDTCCDIGARIKVPPLDPGDSLQVSVVWPTRDQPGFHTIWAVVDPDTMGIDADRSNNAVSDTLTIAESTVDVPGGPGGGKLPRFSFEVEQNYPNPFRPLTTIRYTLPTDALVEISIYDVSGRFVRKVLKEHQKAGPQIAHWDGLDSSGHTMPSGVYFYQVKAGGLVETKRMVLVR